jgi:YtkA-like protein
VHVRVGSRPDARVLKAAAVLTCAVLAAWIAACRSNPAAQITAEWMLDPSPPVANGDVVARVTLRDGARNPVLGAKLRLEGQMSHPGMAPVVADLQERDGGTYEGRVKLTMAGDWVLVVDGQLADGTRITRQLEVPGIRPAG